MEKFFIENGVLLKYEGEEKVVVIPEGVERIGKKALPDFREEYIFPKSLKEVEKQDCSSIEKLVFQSPVIIRRAAFSGAYIKEVIFQRSVIAEKNAFRLNRLTKVVFSEPSEVHEQAFSQNKITEIEGKFTFLATNAFEYNEFRRRLEIVGNVLLSYDFNEKRELFIPEGVEIIAKNAFKNKKLTKVVFPKSLKVIEEGAFTGNDLTEITLESSVDIKEKAFANNKLKKVIFKSPSKVAAHAFYKNEIEEVRGKFIYLDFYAFEKNPIFDKNGFLIVNHTLLYYCGEKTELVIPEGVENIGEEAIKEKGVLKIIFPKSLKKIEENALVGNPLIEVVFQSDVVLAKNSFGEETIKREIQIELKKLETNQELRETIIEIKKLFQENELDISLYLQLLSIINRYQEYIKNGKPSYQQNTELVIDYDVLGKILEIKNRLIALKDTVEANIIINSLNHTQKNIPENIKQIVEYLEITEDNDFKNKILRSLQYLINYTQNQILPSESLKEVINKYEQIAKINLEFILPYHKLWIWLKNIVEKYLEDIQRLNPILKKKALKVINILLEEKNNLEIILKTYKVNCLINLEDFDTRKLTTYHKFISFTNQYSQITQINDLVQEMISYPQYDGMLAEEKKDSLIYQILEEIYILIDLGDLEEPEKQEIIKEIKMSLQKWQTIMQANDFEYQDKTYFNKINIPNKMKYELEIAKELYGIYFRLSFYLDKLSYYKEMTK